MDSNKPIDRVNKPIDRLKQPIDGPKQADRWTGSSPSMDWIKPIVPLKQPVDRLKQPSMGWIKLIDGLDQAHRSAHASASCAHIDFLTDLLSVK